MTMEDIRVGSISNILKQSFTIVVNFGLSCQFVGLSKATKHLRRPNTALI